MPFTASRTSQRQVRLPRREVPATFAVRAVSITGDRLRVSRFARHVRTGIGGGDARCASPAPADVSRRDATGTAGTRNVDLYVGALFRVQEMVTVVA